MFLRNLNDLYSCSKSIIYSLSHVYMPSQVWLLEIHSKNLHADASLGNIPTMAQSLASGKLITWITLVWEEE